MDEPSDDELIERFRRGDVRAFESLVRRHGPGLHAWLLARAGDPGTAEDLFQEVFLAVLDSLAGYEERGRFRAWLFGVARRRTADLFRAAGRRREAPLEAASGSPAPGRTPDLAAEDREDRARLEDAVRRLPPKLRETYALRTTGGLAFREIAEALECPLGTVLARMRYALDRLRSELAEPAAQGAER